MELTKNTVSDYFVSKFKKPQCPFCQEREWEIATLPNKELALFSMIETDNPDTFDLGSITEKPSEPAIGSLVAVRCGNCGWLAYFDTKKFTPELSHESK